MLQRAVMFTHLRATYQFLAARCDLIVGRKLEAHWSYGARRGAWAFISIGVQADVLHCHKQSSTDMAVAIQNRGCDQGMIKRQRHAIGKLVGMENSAPSGQPTDDLPAVRPDTFEIGIANRLRVTERQARRIPGIQTQSWQGIATPY